MKYGCKQEEKLRKEAAREATKERRRLEHEKNRWEKGKFALENTRALIDTSVVEKGLIGGEWNRSIDFMFLTCTFKLHSDHGSIPITKSTPASKYGVLYVDPSIVCRNPEW